MSGDPDRPRLWLLSPQRFYRDIIPRLAEDFDLVLAVDDLDDERRALYRRYCPDADVYDVVEALSAVRRPGEKVASVSASDLEKVGDAETTALVMMDNINFAPVSPLLLRSVLVRHLSLWLGRMHRARPDVVIFHDSPHRGWDYLVYSLCRNLGIRTVIVDMTALDNRLQLRPSVEDVPGPSATEVARAASERPDSADLVGELSHSAIYREGLSRSVHNVAAVERSLGLVSRSRRLVNRGLLHPRQRLDQPSNYAASHEQPFLFAHRVRQTSLMSGSLRLMRRYQEMSEPFDLPPDYVLFPLQLQPERTTVPYGGSQWDQVNDVAMVAESLPPGWGVVVKEHIAQFQRSMLTTKGRNDWYYERLLEIPGVRLAPATVDSEPLIRGARAVATVTGTPGWEAVNLGTPALVFGFPWYARAPGVTLVRSVEDCVAVLEGIATGGPGVDLAEVAAYVELMRSEHTFQGAFDDRLLELSGLTSTENADGYIGALRRALL